MNRRELGQNSSASDLQLSVAYARLLRRWPVIFALGVAGGTLGLLLAGVLLTSYQATAEVSIGADPGRSVWLDEDARTAVMFRVQSLLLSDRTLEHALQMPDLDHASQALPTDAASLRPRLSLTRIESSWQLSARAESPSQAAEVANAWAEAAIEEVEAAVAAATKAGQLQALFFDVSCAPIEVVEADVSLWACDQAQPAGSPADLPQELLNAAMNSHGLVPPMSSSFDRRAVPPARPATPARPVMAIAGLVIGLLTGTLWATVGPASARRPVADSRSEET